MKTRKELAQEYKQKPKLAGVFHVKNTVNGKVLLGSSLNLDGALNRHSFMLKIGKHSNEAMQSDWNSCGAEAFVFEVLETISVKENDPDFNLEDELTLLEQIWLEKVKPFGDHGYNTSERIRQA